MNREDKAEAIKEIVSRLDEAGSVFAFDYRGISVAEGADLRVKLQEAEATFRVVKNRLAKRALADIDAPGLDELLSGPTAIAFVNGDPVVAAKVLATFARDHGVPTYKGGLMDGDPLDIDSFSAIARLPGVDVLRGQLVGMAASPLTQLTRGLAQMIAGLAQQLGEIKDKGLVSGEEPPAEPAAENESPSAEDPTEGAAPKAEGGDETEGDTDPAAPGSETEDAAGEENQEDD